MGDGTGRAMDAGPDNVNPEATLPFTDRLQTLSEISRVVSSTLDLRTLYETIYAEISRVMDATQFFIALHRPERNVLEIPYLREEGELSLDQELPYGKNLTSLVIDRGTPVLFATLRQYLEFGEANALPDITIGNPTTEAMLFVPLSTGSRTIGTLSVQSPRSHVYNWDDLQMLSVIASQAAVAIENARLFSEQQSRVFELQTIQSIVHKITPLHDIPSIASVVNQELKRLIDYHSCRIFLLEDREGVLHAISFNEGEHQDLQLQIGEGITGWIAAHGEPQIVPNTLTDPRSSQIEGTPRREESIIGAPLTYEGRVRGVITLSKLGTNQFDENALRLLEIIAGQAALAFDRARLYDELRRDAITDELTKLYNRRYVFHRFKEEQSRAIRNKHSLAALMLDIDRFKRVNDRYGHDAGDVVLQELAALIRKVVRAEDIVARYGGEEFCVLLPEIPLADAEQVAERLRATVESHTLPRGAGTRQITVSVGMATLQDGDEGVQLFTRADLAMYEIKRLGGNGVCISTAEGLRVRELSGARRRGGRRR